MFIFQQYPWCSKFYSMCCDICTSYFYVLEIILISPPELFQGTSISTVFSLIFSSTFSYSEIQVIIIAKEQNTLQLQHLILYFTGVFNLMSNLEQTRPQQCRERKLQ